MNFPKVTAVFVPPRPEPRREAVVLTLPYEVAQTLLTVTGMIGGYCQGRVNINAIHDALTALKVVEDGMSRFNGCIQEQS